MKRSLSVKIERTSETECTIFLNGALDLQTYDVLDKAFLDMLDEGRVNIKVDLSGLSYISSRGFGIFMEAMATVRERGGELHFVNLSPKAKDIFNLLGVVLKACDE